MLYHSIMVVPKVKNQIKNEFFICIYCMRYVFSFKITSMDVTIVVAVVNKKDSYLGFLE